VAVLCVRNFEKGKQMFGQLKQIEKFCNNYDMYCEGENYHDECGKAGELAEVLKRHHVKSETILQVLEDYFGSYDIP
jgi:hypothetical protein